MVVICTRYMCGQSFHNSSSTIPFHHQDSLSLSSAIERSIMARVDGYGEEVQKRVEDEITCPICHNHFQEPKILPCCHYYCKKCIQSLALRAGENKPFACPECRSDTLLPQNDPSKLPTAFFVNRMKELHTKMGKAHGNVEALCEQCSGGKAAAFCRQCTEFICENCSKIHQSLKIFAGHKMATLEELRKGESKEILVEKPRIPTCAVHDEKLKIYCFSCNTNICRDCTMIDHKDHEYDFIKNTAPKVKQKLTNSLAPLKEVHVHLKNATRTVKSIKSEIEAQGGSVAMMIEQSFVQLCEVIEQRKEELLDKASSVTQRKLKQLNVQENEFEETTTAIQSLVNFVEHNIEKATENELMTIHVQMLNRITEETNRHQLSTGANLEPVERANIVVEVRCVEELWKLCQEKTSLVECSMDGSGLNNAELGKTAHVKVTYKSTNPVTIGSKMTYTHGSVQNNKVQRVQENEYQIEYVPRVRGRHKLEITANGLPLVGSPYTVLVTVPAEQLGKTVKVIGGVKQPMSIAINSAGEKLIAEQYGDVKVLVKGDKKVHTVEGFQYGFKELRGIAVDKDNNTYLTDRGTGKLSKFNQKFEVIKEVQRGKVRDLELFNPWGVTCTSGEQVVIGSRSPPYLYIFDNNLELKKKIDLESAGIGDVMGIAGDDNGNLYICDYNGGCVHVLSPKGCGERLFSFGKEELLLPYSICIYGGLVYVSDWKVNVTRKCIFVFSKRGELMTSFAKCGPNEGQLSLPSGLAFDADGILYVCDRTNDRLQLF